VAPRLAAFALTEDTFVSYDPNLPPQPPQPSQPWQRIDVLPGGHSTHVSRRSLPSLGTAGITALSLVVVAGAGYAAWHQLDKPSSSPHVAAHPVVAAPSSAAAAPVQPSPTPTSNAKISATGWDLTTVHPVTAPVTVAGRIVVYTADAGQLTLRALDPSSGATLWSLPASTAQNTPGEPFSVAYLGTTVFYFVEADAPSDHVAKIAAVDASTGKQKWVTAQSVSYADMPSLCSDNAALCDAAYSGPNQSQEVRTDVTTGDQTLLSSSTGRSLGVGVWDAGVRKPEYIEHINDTTGAVVWKDPVVQLFGTSVSSDNGWNWDSYGTVYVGWLGNVPANPTSHTVNLGAQEMVAVRASDGVRLWHRSGLYGCPAQGLTDTAGKPIAVRCLVSGTATLDANGGDPTVRGLDVTIQGFNVQTGATLWSYHAGNVPGAIGIGSTGAVRISGDVFALTNAAGRTTLIDIKTGATSAPSASTVGWCLQNGTYKLTGVDDQAGTPIDFTSGELIAPCTPSGAPGKPGDGTATGAGTTVGGYFVWSSTDGLHAFKVGVPT
jgi:hypothetical protein